MPWGLALAAIALYARERGQPVPKAPPVGRFVVRLKPDAITGAVWQAMALSPDGSRFVYVGATASGQQIFTRLLDQLDAVPVPRDRQRRQPVLLT